MPATYSLPPNISRLGITCLFEDLNSQVDIVLIHGLNGQPARTWASASTGFFWPAELRPYLENARVMLFGYNADVSPTLDENRARVLGIARGLLANLANYRRRPQEIDRPLIFVGHSLGGLVIKAALVEAHSVLESKIDEWDRIYNSTGGIIFFGVPNVGSDASRQKRLRLLERVHVINIPPLLEQALRLHSLDTVDLATNFRRLPLCTRRLLYMYSYIEQRTTAALGEVVVDETSASIGYDRETIVPIDSDHEGMVKFRDYQDNDFLNVIGQLSYITSKLLERAALQSHTSSSSGHSANNQPMYSGSMQQYHTPSSNVVNQAPKQFQLPPPNSAEQLARNQELIAAAGRGDLATVRRLHEAGAIQLSPLGQDGNQSALAAAVTTYQNNHDTATNGWYSSGAMADIGNAMLQTSKSCAGVIRYLLDNGTDWNSLTPNQQSAARRALT